MTAIYTLFGVQCTTNSAERQCWTLIVKKVSLFLLRHIIPKQLPSIQYSQLPSSHSPHEAQFPAWPVSKTPPPIPLSSLQICRQHPTVPSGSHSIPDHFFSSASHWSHSRELKHDPDVSCQAALFAPRYPPSSQECRAPPVSLTAASAVRREDRSTDFAFILFIIIIPFSSNRWGVFT